MRHSIKTLPKWAREMIIERDSEIDRLSCMVGQLRKITRQLDEGRGEWFTLFHPALSIREGSTNLFILQHNHAQPVCSLGENDFIMVCRAERQVPNA